MCFSYPVLLFRTHGHSSDNKAHPFLLKKSYFHWSVPPAAARAAHALYCHMARGKLSNLSRSDEPICAFIFSGLGLKDNFLRHAVSVMPGEQRSSRAVVWCSKLSEIWQLSRRGWCDSVDKFVRLLFIFKLVSTLGRLRLGEIICMSTVLMKPVSHPYIYMSNQTNW